MKIRISGTENDSIVDGPGIRFTIFVQGCPHNCDGCHNMQTHDFKGGREVEITELTDKIKDNPLLTGVTFSGGEPFCKASELVEIAKIIKADTSLDIMTYTGYTYEYLLANSNDENCYKKLIEMCDVIVDGKFEKDKKSYELLFKGSSNQRIIDCKKSLEQGKVVEIFY